MLTFLALAARKRLTVERYTDRAVGYLEKNQDGRLAITRVILRPVVEFGTDSTPEADELKQLHEMAHHGCFIANSVRTAIEVAD
jgi:organic hydroperoxide reductase OsmC/OhrA